MVVAVRKENFVPGFLALLAEREELGDLLPAPLLAIAPKLVGVVQHEVALPLRQATSDIELRQRLDEVRPRLAEILGAVGLLFVRPLQSSPDQIVASQLRRKLAQVSRQSAESLEQRFGSSVAHDASLALHGLTRNFLSVSRGAPEEAFEPFLDAFALIFALEQDKVALPQVVAALARERSLTFAALVKRVSNVVSSAEVSKHAPQSTEDDRHFVRLALADWVRRTTSK